MCKDVCKNAEIGFLPQENAHVCNLLLSYTRRYSINVNGRMLKGNVTRNNIPIQVEESNITVSIINNAGAMFPTVLAVYVRDKSNN